MNEPVVLDLIAHTDFSGAIRPAHRSPGAAVLGAAFEHFRERNPGGTIVLDAGDLAQAAPASRRLGRAGVVELINRFRYDAVTLGNHEFDFGLEALCQMLAPATFPILCANVIDAATGDVIDVARPWIMLDKLGVRVGVIGVTTAYTPFMMFREAFEGLEIRDPIAVCRELVPAVRAAGADVVVVLGHLPGTIGPDGERTGELFEVARGVDGIDVLVGGHNPGDIACQEGATALTKTGFSGVAVGHVRLRVDRAERRVEILDNEIIGLLPPAFPIEPDAEIAAAVDAAIAPWRSELDEVIGTAEDDLVVASRGEFALGNLFTDCMREVTGAEVAIINSTSCFGLIPAGPITVEHLEWVNCFNEHVHVGPMSGRQILAVVELTYDDTHRSLNGDLQFSGLRVEIDLGRPTGRRVVSITLDDGRRVDPDGSYLVATSAYLADGGNGYLGLMSATPWTPTELLTHDINRAGVRARGSLSSAVEGRIVERADAETTDPLGAN